MGWPKASTPVNFPNLCKVANTKSKADPTFHNCHSTKKQLSGTPEYEIEAALAKPSIKRRLLDSCDIEELKVVFHATEDISLAKAPVESSTADM